MNDVIKDLLNLIAETLVEQDLKNWRSLGDYVGFMPSAEGSLALVEK